MADEDKPKSAVKRLAEYTDEALNAFEFRRVRRSMDVVDEMEADKVFYVKLKTKVRAWVLMIGLAAATWTAAATLKGPLRTLLLNLLAP